MAFMSVLFGLLLIALGAVGYLKPDLIGESPSTMQATALIPAYFGAGLLLCGLWVIFRPGVRKFAMHLAALIGVLGLAGALMRPISTLIKGQSLDFNAAAVRSQLTMAVLCFLFVFLCVRSFIHARRAR
jgi:hypothetical protein